MCKIWLKNYCQTLFLKIKTKHIFELTVWTYRQFAFILCPSWGLPKYIETKVLTTCFTSYKAVFKKQKEVWNYSPCLIFCIIFQEKFFPCYILLPDQISLSDYMRNKCIIIICFQVVDAIKFEINLSFIIKLFSYMTKKVRTKRAFKIKQMHFFIIFRVFIQTNKIKCFWEVESDFNIYIYKTVIKPWYKHWT